MAGLFGMLAATRAGRAATVAVLAALTVATAVPCQRLLIHPTWAVAEDPGYAPFGAQRILVPTADGETLLAYWRRPLPGRPTLVSFHDAAGDALAPAIRFSHGPWAEDGWGFLTVTSRGYPGSSGTPGEAGLARDADAALAYLRRRLGPDRQVVAHGSGLGAAVAVALAARGGVSGLYLEAPFLSLRAAVAARAPWIPGALLLDRFASDALAPGLSVPTEVVHGTADAEVPFEQGRRLAALIPGAAFVPVPGAGHDVAGAADATVEAALTATLQPWRVEATARVTDEPEPAADGQ